MTDRTPDCLTGKKYTRQYRGENLYFSIFPEEVFISAWRETDQKTVANLDIISRLVSMVLRTHTLDDVLDQLNKASRSPSDIPGILATVLSEGNGEIQC